MLVGMGAEFVDSIEAATHLVAESIVRTEKMLCAICLGKLIVRKGWINQCIQHGSFVG